jgi:predicted dehydrogenase
MQSSMGAALTKALGVGSVLGSAQTLPSNTSVQAGTPVQVRFGIIGIGMEGTGLLKTAVAIPGIRCVAACDLYDERQVLAREIAGNDVRVTRRYRDLLESKDVDCVIVATPDHWHKQIMLDAVAAGKDVYCEKPMSHSIAEGAEMVQAVQATDRIVQIGSQRVSSIIFAKAKEMIAGGAIGRVSLVELTMGRNEPQGAWEYPPPPGLSEQNLDWIAWQGTVPKKPFDPNTFARWRCWRAYGSGVAGDLMVHLLSGMQFALGLTQMPDRATAFGEIVRWKDGRDMPDLHLVLFEYGELIVSVRLTLDTESVSLTRFMGSKGVIEVTPTQIVYSPQPGVDLRPSSYVNSFPRAMREAYEQQWHAENDPKLAALPPLKDMQTFQGVSSDELRPHLENFFHSVVTRKPVVEDVVFGHNAAAACHMANQSYFQKAPVTRQSAL